MRHALWGLYRTVCLHSLLTTSKSSLCWNHSSKVTSVCAAHELFVVSTKFGSNEFRDPGDYESALEVKRGILWAYCLHSWRPIMLKVVAENTFR